VAATSCTVPNEFLSKLDLVGKDLAEYSRENRAIVLIVTLRLRLIRSRRPVSRRSEGEGNYGATVREGTGNRRCRLLRGGDFVPQLLSRGYKVTVYDIMFFGNRFLPRITPTCASSTAIFATPRNLRRRSQAMMPSSNLACISNDASFALDEDLSTSINLNAFEPIGQSR